MEGYPTPAQTSSLAELSVDWEAPLVLDPPWLFLKGHLRARRNSDVVPVNAFLGVGVLLSRQASVRQEWATGFDPQHTFSTLTILDPDGSFSVCLDPAEIDRIPGGIGQYQAGVVICEANTSEEGVDVSLEREMSVLHSSLTTLDISGPPTLSETMRIINGAPSPHIRSYDPVALIRVANHLRLLGKAETLEQLRAFVGLSWRGEYGCCTLRRPRDAANIDTADEQSLLLVLRILFDVPSGSKHPRIGGSPIKGSLKENDEIIDLFPLVVYRDIPFLVVHSVFGKTPPCDVLEIIGWYERFGILRNDMLSPAGNPVEDVFDLIQIRGILRDNFSSWNILEQAGRMLSEIDGMKPPARDRSLDGVRSGGQAWEELLRQSKIIGIHWDSSKQRFVGQ